MLCELVAKTLDIRLVSRQIVDLIQTIFLGPTVC